MRSSQISSAGKVVRLAVNLPSQKYFRLERNFLCNRPGNGVDLKAANSWGGDMLSVNGTTLRNIRIGVAATSKPPLLRPLSPAPSVTFRLWR